MPLAPQGAGYMAGTMIPSTVSTPGMLGEAQHFIPGKEIPDQWWRLFHSRPLNALVERALAENPTLAAARAALRAARENVLAQEGSLFPSVGLDASDARIRTATGALAPTSASGAPEYTLYTGQLNISYAVDVFGLNRRMIESTAAQAETQRFQMEAAHLTLTTNVVVAAAREAGLRSEIAAQQDIIKAESTVTDIVRSQYKLGDVSEANLLQQEAVLAQARGLLPPLQKQLALQHNALIALVGGFPNEDIAQQFDLSSLRVPRDLPVSLPSELVAQRPDIRAAAANLHAASAQVGVAIANRLPKISLSANAGTAVTTLASSVTPTNMFFTMAGGLTQPLFDGGTLLHKEGAAKALFDEATSQYRATVIGAFRDVADTLHALQSDAEALRAAVTAERAAARSFDTMQQQLKLGSTSYLYVLDAERTYEMARLGLVQAQVMRLADTAALFQALGGGWRESPDLPGDPG